jgi:hypothetical protein
MIKKVIYFLIMNYIIIIIVKTPKIILSKLLRSF